MPFLLQTLYKQSFFLTLRRSVETYYRRALLLLVLPSFLSFCLFNYWRACYLSQGNQYGAAVALSLLTRLSFSLYPACPNRHTNTYLVRLCSKSLFVNLFLCSTSVNFICFLKCNLNTYPQTSLFVYLFLFLLAWILYMTWLVSPGITTVMTYLVWLTVEGCRTDVRWGWQWWWRWCRWRWTVLRSIAKNIVGQDGETFCEVTHTHIHKALKWDGCSGIVLVC